jgi:hypothetical protein
MGDGKNAVRFEVWVRLVEAQMVEDPDLFGGLQCSLIAPVSPPQSYTYIMLFEFQVRTK